MDDELLVRACRDGDAQAWLEMIERYGRLVYAIPRRHGLDVDGAEDVFQDVFTALVQQLPRLRDPRALPGWFTTTTLRLTRDHCLRHRSHAALVSDVRDEEPPPIEHLADAERADGVARALHRLGGRCEELLTILFRARPEVGYDEIAGQLGIPRGSIGPTRARCLRKLVRLLDEGEP